MNHENRIKKLEKELAKVKRQILQLSGSCDDFLPLSQASTHLGINPWVIRNRIKNDTNVELGKHFRMNGNRYQINVEEWRELILSDVKAKHQ